MAPCLGVEMGALMPATARPVAAVAAATLGQ